MDPMSLFMWGIYSIIAGLVVFALTFIASVISQEEEWIVAGLVVLFGLTPCAVAVWWIGAVILAIIQAL